MRITMVLQNGSQKLFAHGAAIQNTAQKLLAHGSAILYGIHNVLRIGFAMLIEHAKRLTGRAIKSKLQK